jgi:nitrite reductase (cytochrome c-552)
MSSVREIISRRPWVGWLLFLATVVLVFLIGLLSSSIVERRSESVALQVVKPIADWEPRNEVWGQNYPREYDSYRRTLQTDFASLYAGSVEIDYLKRYPELVVLWAGYSFSKDYKQARGHAYAVRDIRETLRTGGTQNSPMVATCWTCKSTDVPRVMEENGVAQFYQGKWIDKGAEIVNPIGCQDCHDPRTMNLRITRPALIEALQTRGKDLETLTHNEMRSLVCAQCHVEYYFRDKTSNYLLFPWELGFSADEMEEYFDNLEFSDWTHGLSRAPMLKAQHPDYELYKTGVHASRDVSCADCHMPYRSEGGVKFTDHHIQSPLANVSNSCAVCHREETARLTQDVYERQDRIMELRRIAEKALAAAHLEAQIAWENGANQEQMRPVQRLIRHGQWRWDWVAAANGVGFHSPVEAMRVLGTSIQKAEEARRFLALILVSQGVEYPVALPDISTKALAQSHTGLDVEILQKQKEDFLQTIVPEWDREAEERQGSLQEY